MSWNRSTIRIWLLVMILVTSLAGAPVFAQGATTVRVDPSEASLQVNEITNIAIKIDNVSNVIAFELHLSFNPGVLEVTSLSNGGFVAADFEAQKIFDNSAGTIDYAIAQMNRAPAQGSGTLLNISIRAKASGSSSIATRATPAAPGGLILSDANGMAIQASWLPGNINIGTSAITSTPITPTPFTPAPITNTPTYTPTGTTIVTPCDDDSCPTATYTPTPTNSPTSTTTTTPITPTTSTPTFTSTPGRTPTITPSPAGPSGVHIVRWGEWIYCIARAYRVSPSAIIQSNHLWWPYIIFSNQRLTIPNVPWTNMTAGPVCQAQFTFPAPTPPATATPVTPAVTHTPVTITPPSATPILATTVPPAACRAIYVVRRGDTLYRIANRYGTTYTELARLNGIPNPRIIYPGQRLCIP